LFVVCAYLTHLAASKTADSDVVDIYTVNPPPGTWSTGKLSEARHKLAATSLPNVGVAFFAGGYGILQCPLFESV
jgi:hypothetical protein